MAGFAHFDGQSNTAMVDVSAKAECFDLREAAGRGKIPEGLIWDTLKAFAGYEFYTSRGLKFTYKIRGYEMFVDRKKKSITRSSVLLFVRKAEKLQSLGEKIEGPKAVGTFGASYLFPIFKSFGLLD